jgi:hypothetical protein
MISECCGAEDVILIVFGTDIKYSDIHACPECHAECNFITEEEFGEEYAKAQIKNALGEEDETRDSVTS